MESAGKDQPACKRFWLSLFPSTDLQTAQQVDDGLSQVHVCLWEFRPGMNGDAGLAILLSVASLLGLILNLYILVLVLLTKQVEGGGRLLLGHLGLVGSALCCLCLSCATPALLGSRPALPCPVAGFLFTTLHPVALWTLTGLNADRWAAISSPLHYGSLVRPRRVALGLIVSWTISLALAIPPLFSFPAPYTFSLPLAACTPNFGAPSASWYSLLYLSFTLILPAALIIACNLKVLMIARYHRHRIARAIFEVTISAQVTITHQKNPFLMTGSRIQRRSASVSVLQLVGSLLILYGPYYLVVLLKAVGNEPTYPLLATSSAVLAASPSLNGLLYGLKNKSLRRTFHHYWRKKMTKSELEQEIQARTPSRRPSLTPQRGLVTGLSPRGASAVCSLKHSATATSILAQPRPKILVTRANSIERGFRPARATLKLGGSSSSLSGESDVTQEEDRDAFRWGRLSFSSCSLPA